MNIKLKFSLSWWLENIKWLIGKFIEELSYCTRWIISLVPGYLGRKLRQYCWGIGKVGKNVNIDEGCWV